MRPLILGGGPAAGKSTSAKALAIERDRAAYIDADDIRQLVVAGDATLWSGTEGQQQHILAARNVAAMARNFTHDGFDVTIADYLTTASLATYRHELPNCFIVHLQLSLAEARQRAKTRRVYLTDDEFDLLHEMIAVPPKADLILEVDHLTPEQQIRAIRTAWTSA